MAASVQTARPQPGQALYQPYGEVEALFYSRDPELVLSGPAGTGKSRGCLEKLHLCACKYPGMRALIARKTRRSITQTAQVTYEQHVLPTGWLGQWIGWRTGEQEYRYPNGAVIVVGGLDKGSKVMSAEYDLIYVQEATELLEEDWEALSTRLRNGKMPYQQLFGDVNPTTPLHWVKQRANRGTIRMLDTRHEENPRLYDRRVGTWTVEGIAYLARLDRLTGARKARLRYGQWTQAEGLVYDGWDRAVHLVSGAELVARGWVPAPTGPVPLTAPPAAYIPADWPRYRVIDFGYTNPFVCQWWAEDPDGRLYLYRELVGVQRTVNDWATAIWLAEIAPAHLAGLRVAYAAQDPAPPVSDPPTAAEEVTFVDWVRRTHPEATERITTTITDHDAEDRATLTSRGIATAPAIKEVTRGIQAVTERLRAAGDHRPRLYILADALVGRDRGMDEAKTPQGWAEEIESYVWPKVAEGRVVKEDPVKKDDHSMDTGRYMVAYKDLQNAQVGVSWL